MTVGLELISSIVVTQLWDKLRPTLLQTSVSQYLGNLINYTYRYTWIMLLDLNSIPYKRHSPHQYWFNICTNLWPENRRFHTWLVHCQRCDVNWHSSLLLNLSLTVTVTMTPTKNKSHHHNNSHESTALMIWGRLQLIEPALYWEMKGGKRGRRRMGAYITLSHSPEPGVLRTAILLILLQRRSPTE